VLGWWGGSPTSVLLYPSRAVRWVDRRNAIWRNTAAIHVECHAPFHGLLVHLQARCCRPDPAKHLRELDQPSIGRAQLRFSGRLQVVPAERAPRGQRVHSAIYLHVNAQKVVREVSRNGMAEEP
jgi:hypothetical protein